MKITAGIGSTDQFCHYTAAGADEVFAGYVPDSWMEKYGNEWPLNRREVRYCPVQLGGRNELRRLSSMAKDFGVPAVLTFNSPFYRPDLIPQVAGVMQECMQDGFFQYIIADPALLIYLHDHGLLREMELHISGEMGEINRFVLKEWKELGAKRIIFHRKTGIENMRSMIQHVPGLCYEAFAMNEMCHFHGAFCSSLHCDELPHMCHVPWKLAPVRDGQLVSIQTRERKDRQGVIGSSGCGLCALQQLREAGIDYLKVVGRGAQTEEMVDTIRLLRNALDLLDSYSSEDMWKRDMREKLFAGKCSGICYY